MNIRKAAAGDASALAALAALQPSAAQWTEADFQSELALDCAFIWCAELDGICVGFVAARAAAGQGEILNVAVHPQYTRRGIGRQLLAHALAELHVYGTMQISLEAAEHNAAANRLYEQAGFHRCVRRKNFYGVGRDAWIWEKNL